MANYGPIGSELYRRLGGGENRLATQRLYSRIERSINIFGDPALKILRELMEDCRTKDKPGVYFRMVAPRRFHEHGFWEASKNEQGPNQRAMDARQLAANVGKMPEK